MAQTPASYHAGPGSILGQSVWEWQFNSGYSKPKLRDLGFLSAQCNTLRKLYLAHKPLQV